MSKSTAAAAARKPALPKKPYDGFPLFPHRSGRWAKKIKGELHYFGRWGHVQSGKVVPVADVNASATAAKNELDRQWSFIVEGRTPPAPGNEQPDVCTMKVLCNRFWKSKRAKLLAGELSQRSFADYERTTDLLDAFFGKERRVDDLQPEDFQSLRSSLAERLGKVALGNEINRIRCVFRFARKAKLIADDVVYGDEFNRPSQKTLRKARKAAGKRMFSAAELRTILDYLDGKPISVEGIEKPVERKPDPAMKAMVLLGLNCGFGNTDVATLPQSALDLEKAWTDFPRPKTAIDRRIPLWPETVAALKEAIAIRKTPAGREYADLCFVTRTGMPYVRVQQQLKNAERFQPLDSLTQQFSKLLHRLKINGRVGLGFYTLRHVFETVAGESRDQVAVDAIMGHVDASMAGQYREGISDERLQAVVGTVRAWLWPVAAEGGAK